MALVLKIEKDSITTNCSTITFSDNTGNYDASNNTGGYGAPNETRANLGLKLFVIGKFSGGDVNMTVTNSDDTDPGAVSDFTVTHSDDTIYEVILYGIKDYDAGTTYAEDEIVYDPSGEKFYKSKQDSNTGNSLGDAAWWEEATLKSEFEKAVETDGQSDTYFDREYIMEICNNNTCLNNKINDLKCSCMDFCDMKDHEYLRWLLEAATIKHGLDNYTEAQEVIEEATDYCGGSSAADCGCG